MSLPPGERATLAQIENRLVLSDPWFAARFAALAGRQAGPQTSPEPGRRRWPRLGSHARLCALAAIGTLVLIAGLIVPLVATSHASRPASQPAAPSPSASAVFWGQ